MLTHFSYKIKIVNFRLIKYTKLFLNITNKKIKNYKTYEKLVRLLVYFISKIILDIRTSCKNIGVNTLKKTQHNIYQKYLNCAPWGIKEVSEESHKLM